MPDVHYVAVLHDIVFALQPQRAARSGVGLRAGVEELIPVDGLGADEMFLEIGMDRSGSGLGAGSPFNRPRPAFVFDVLSRSAFNRAYSGSAKKMRIACRLGKQSKATRCGFQSPLKPASGG